MEFAMTALAEETLVRSVASLPPPHGPYAIGTTTYHWVDEDRQEIFTNKRSDWRELMAQIWYPARQFPDAPRVRYTEDSSIFAPMADLLHLPVSTFAGLQDISTNAVREAPVAAENSYPVLIFLHGRGGFRGYNTVLAEELVSHGYVVVAIDQPFAASGVIFPDGRRAEFDRRMMDRGFIDKVIPFLSHDVLFS
jgi:predicted dienelactone hydrolase